MAVARHFHNNFRIADFDVLGDWDLSKVVKVGDCIPGYRYSASKYFAAASSFYSFPSLPIHQAGLGIVPNVFPRPH